MNKGRDSKTTNNMVSQSSATSRDLFGKTGLGILNFSEARISELKDVKGPLDMAAASIGVT